MFIVKLFNSFSTPSTPPFILQSLLFIMTKGSLTHGGDSIPGDNPCGGEWICPTFTPQLTHHSSQYSAHSLTPDEQLRLTCLSWL